VSPGTQCFFFGCTNICIADKLIITCEDHRTHQFGNKPCRSYAPTLPTALCQDVMCKRCYRSSIASLPSWWLYDSCHNNGIPARSVHRRCSEELVLSCPLHGVFSFKRSLQRNMRCKQCWAARAETSLLLALKKELEQRGLDLRVAVREKRYPVTGLCRFDLALPALNVVIELDGQQHFEPVPYWRSNPDKVRGSDVAKIVGMLSTNISIIHLLTADVRQSPERMAGLLVGILQHTQHNPPASYFLEATFSKLYDRHIADVQREGDFTCYRKHFAAAAEFKWTERKPSAFDQQRNFLAQLAQPEPSVDQLQCTLPFPGHVVTESQAQLRYPSLSVEEAKSCSLTPGEFMIGPLKKSMGFLCSVPDCPHRAAFRSVMNEHLYHHHHPESLMFRQCDVDGCGRVCRNSVALRLHVLRQHGTQFRGKCTICGKVFNRHYLALHMGSHAGVKWTCPIEGCGQQYSRKQHLLEHHRKRHMKDGLPLACTVPGCVWKFSVPFRLKAHLLRHASTYDLICDGSCLER